MRIGGIDLPLNGLKGGSLKPARAPRQIPPSAAMNITSIKAPSLSPGVYTFFVIDMAAAVILLAVFVI